MEPTLIIGDIVERDTREEKPTEFGEGPFSATGFPQPKKRWKTSAFKQQRLANSGSSAWKSEPGPPRSHEADAMSPRGVQPPSFDDIERRRIGRENQQKLDNMSREEIAQAQDDLMNGLNPELVKRLLQRATIDEPTGPSPFDEPLMHEQTPNGRAEGVTGSDPIAQRPDQKAKQSIEQPAKPKPMEEPSKEDRFSNYDEDKAPPQVPPNLFPITDPPSATHFPTPRALPDLNPSDPDFLETLHKKYFPDLPADPSKLAWMAPIPTTDSPADQDSPYYPHSEISVSSLRFDFRGRFLSPRVSRSIPSSKGLHHHGEAPEAAGYTVAELAHLARSAVPAQRCMAFQTLGRILYRLGRGEWGKTINDPIATGVWAAAKQGRVLETLMEAASAGRGHQGSRAYATEALWLFEKGGWREQVQGR